MITCRCRMCGSTFQSSEDMSVDTCDFCGANNTLPMIGDDRLVKLFDRAAAYRLENEYDRSLATYDTILAEIPNNAEAHFGKLLCKFGLEYIADEWSGVRNPVCHRVHTISVLEDEDYLAAIEHAKPDAKEIYETVAYQIDFQQKKFKEEEKSVNADFDIYISDKEEDERNRPTRDSELAHHLYDYLRARGFKVFLASKTLEGKNFQQFEPHIHAALHNVKAMIVVTTKREYVTWPWVKNEWYRYFDLCAKSNRTKTIITCYDEMDPLDLPRELAMYSMLDMSKAGYEEELLSKILDVVSPSGAPIEAPKEEAPIETSGSIGNLFDGPQFAMAAAKEPIPQETTVEEANSVADVVETPVAPVPDPFDDPIKQVAYIKAAKMKETAKNADEFKDAAAAFAALNGYKDSRKLADECNQTASDLHSEVLYVEAMRSYKKSATAADYARTKLMFETIPGYKDADGKARECAILTNRLKREDEKRKIEEAKKLEEANMQSTVDTSAVDEEILLNTNTKAQVKRQRFLIAAMMIALIGVEVAWSMPYWDNVKALIESFSK